MISLENLKAIKFDYYDENGYIYNFVMLENRTEKISENEYRFYLICENTNVSANGEIFFNIKLEDKQLSFRTDYFANSFDYVNIKEDEEKSTSSNKIYSVTFGSDILELELIY